MPTNEYYGQDIINQAAVTLEAIASGESLNPSELNDGLVALNKIVDGWSMLGLLILQVAESSTTNMSGITVNGSPGKALTFRPSKIKAARCTNGPLSSPVEMCSAEQWSQILDESRTGAFVAQAFCDYAYPNSNLFWWPTVNANASVLTIYYHAALQQWPDLGTTLITLAPGMARGLTLNLALDLAEQYGKPITQTLLNNAKEAKNEIGIANAKIFGADPPPDLPMPQSPGKQVMQAQPPPPQQG